MVVFVMFVATILNVAPQAGLDEMPPTGTVSVSVAVVPETVPEMVPLTVPPELLDVAVPVTLLPF